MSEWTSLQHSFYLSTPGFMHNDIPEIEGSFAKIVQVETLKIPGDYIPTTYVPPDGELFSLLPRPGFFDPCFPQKVRMEILCGNTGMVPREYRKHYIFSATHQPTCAIRQTTHIDIIDTTADIGLFKIDYNQEDPSGRYSVCGTLGFLLDGRKEILKLQSSQDSTRALFAYILVLVDPTALHPSVALEVSKDAFFAEHYLKKWKQWNKALPASQETSEQRLYSILACLIQTIQHRRRLG